MAKHEQERESDLESLENAFPSVAGLAFSDARLQALQMGLSVMQSEDGVIYEVSPDGKKVEVKKIDPPVKVDSRKKYRLP